MTNILLTGAGFSRNWGGWLADEAFEYLLGDPQIDAPIRVELWSDKNKGDGYEVTLARLQQNARKDATGTVQSHVNALTSALAGMFNLMHQGLATTPFERNGDVAKQVTTFLLKFDAIFTLNQDLLLEEHYQRGIDLVGGRRFRGMNLPHLTLMHSVGGDERVPVTAPRVPVETMPFKVWADLQPYFKLHGSMNWFDKAGGRLLIMGGNKTAAISSSPLLNWYAEQFDAYLNRPNARLMIIGYGFGDEHINQALLRGNAKGLKTFIIDPKGIDVLDRRSKVGIPGPPTGMMAIQPNVIGASRRSLISTFGGDDVEHARVMKFFDKW